MGQIEKSQIRDIYALAAGLGMVERERHDDGLHDMVTGLTGKDGVSKLTKAEAEQILAELMNRMRLTKQPAPKSKQHHETAGGMTGGQQRYV